MKKILSLIFSVFLVFFANAEDKISEAALVAVHNTDGSFSYIDASGAVIIPGPFLTASDFSEGLGRVEQKKGFTSFVDGQGKIVFTLDIDFSKTADFSEGLAWFVQDGNMGFVNKQGKISVPAKFTPLSENRQNAPGSLVPSFFTDGLVQAREKKILGWVTPGGQFISSPWQNFETYGNILNMEFPGIGPFSEGLAAVAVDQNYGYADSTGKIVIAPAWDEARPFHEGLAAVRKGELWGFIDKQGKLVIPVSYTSAKDFKTFAVVGIKEGLTLIDKKGQQITAQFWSDLETAEDPELPLPDNPLWVISKDGKQGLMDSKGQVVLTPVYDEVRGFSENAGLVVLNGRLGLVDRQGKEIIPPKYEDLGFLTQGRVAFSENGKWGWLDSSGKVVLEPQWAWAGDFHEGLASVFDGKGGALVDLNGKPVTPFDYQQILNPHDGLRQVKKDGKFGYLDLKGNLVIPAVFDLAQGFQDGWAWVVQNSQAFRIDSKGQKIEKDSYSGVGLSTQGECTMVQKGGKVGFIDSLGNWSINPIYDAAVSYSEGKALVGLLESSGGRWMYCDKQGHELFSKAEWKPYGSFKENRVFVITGKNDQGELVLGLCDQDGKILSTGYKDVYGGFHEGFAALQFADGHWGYIDPQGTQLFPGKIWDKTYPFSDGIAAVVQDNHFGFIDTKGELIIPPQFDRAGGFINGLVWVEAQGREAFLDKTGKEVWSSKPKN